MAICNPLFPTYRHLPFVSVIKNIEFDISKGLIDLFFRKRKIFGPFLQYYQISQNWVTNQNELQDRHIRFQDKKLHFFNNYAGRQKLCQCN